MRKTTIYHLMFKIQGELEHHYYSSLTALCKDNEGELNVSLSKLQKWDWKKDYENQLVVIRKSYLTTNKMVQEYYGE